MRQHEALERLNMQSHANAKANADEFVMEAMITHEKLPLLVHELLVAELWGDAVFPRMRDVFVGPQSMRAYFCVRCPPRALLCFVCACAHNAAGARTRRSLTAVPRGDDR